METTPAKDVYILEDQSMFAHRLKRQVQELGYNPVVFSYKQSFMEAVSEKLPYASILDNCTPRFAGERTLVNMGYECARDLLRKYPSVKFAMHTSRPTDELIKLGVAIFSQKPVELGELSDFLL